MDQKISIVFEDENFLVLNKPAGLIVHPKNISDDQPSVVDWVKANYPELKDVGEPFDASGSPLSRHGIVHRLDKETSGLIIITKNQPSFDYFKNLFQTRKIKKYYLTLVYGQLREGRGIISAPLGRIGLKRTTIKKNGKLVDQKEAETEYTVKQKFRDYTLLEARPKTGRTHQIRVHLKSINHPIVGDFIYASGKPLPKNLNRLFLHAYKLEFTTPSGKALVTEVDLPDDLQNVLNELE